MDKKDFLLGILLSFSAFMMTDYFSLFSSDSEKKNDNKLSYLERIGSYFNTVIENYEREKQ